MISATFVINVICMIRVALSNLTIYAICAVFIVCAVLVIDVIGMISVVGVISIIAVIAMICAISMAYLPFCSLTLMISDLSDLNGLRDRAVQVLVFKSSMVWCWWRSLGR